MKLENLKINPLLPKSAFANGDIVWVLRTLCCGGIERQLVTNAVALHEQGVTNINLLCSTLAPEAGYDFFLPQAKPVFKSIKLINDLPDPVVEEFLPLSLEVISNLTWMPQAKQNDFVLYLLWMLYLRPRVAHVWGGDAPVSALAACIAGVPKVILSGQSLPPNKRTPYGFEGPNVEETFTFYKYLCLYSSLVMTNNSCAGRQEYARWLGLSPDEIHVFHNAIEEQPPVKSESVLALKESLGIKPGTKIIGGAFRFASIKDPGLWINSAALALRKQDNAVAVLWGDGPLLEPCRKAVADLGLTDKILLPGKTNDVYLALSICDVMLLTSFVEGLPNVVLEAQVLGIPVVTTNAGGVADAVLDETLGWIVKKRDPRLLADRILFVLENEEWRKRVFENAPKYIAKKFSFTNSVSLLKQMYA